MRPCKGHSLLHLPVRRHGIEPGCQKHVCCICVGFKEARRQFSNAAHRLRHHTKVQGLPRCAGHPQSVHIIPNTSPMPRRPQADRRPSSMQPQGTITEQQAGSGSVLWP